MNTFVVVAILGALLAWVLIMFFKKSEAPPLPLKSREDLANLKITDAGVGDAVSIAGAGADFADLDFTVAHRNRYELGEREISEVSGSSGERHVSLEISVDEEGEIEVRAVLDPTKLTLDRLGLTEEDLESLDERQNPADSFEYDNKVWLYRWSREAGFFRDGQTEGKGFYWWEFQEDGGKRSLSIKKWEGEPFSAVLATKLNPADITVYRGA